MTFLTLLQSVGVAAPVEEEETPQVQTDFTPYVKPWQIVVAVAQTRQALNRHRGRFEQQIVATSATSTPLAVLGGTMRLEQSILVQTSQPIQGVEMDGIQLSERHARAINDLVNRPTIELEDEMLVLFS